jgi:hypothetical protein
MSKPPVRCTVCDTCTCFCAKTLDDILDDDNHGLEAVIARIKEHEDYLRYLREALTKIQRGT